MVGKGKRRQGVAESGSADAGWANPGRRKSQEWIIPHVSAPSNKVSIVGVGSVGTAIAYACLIRGSAKAIALFDVAAKKVQAEVLDPTTAASSYRTAW